MSKRASPALRSLVFALPAVLSSCFTAALWGFWRETERDPVTGVEDAAYAYDEETEWSWELLGLRVLLTPVTLCLDCVTCPVQAYLGLVDEDDSKENGKR